MDFYHYRMDVYTVHTLPTHIYIQTTFKVNFAFDDPLNGTKTSYMLKDQCKFDFSCHDFQVFGLVWSWNVCEVTYFSNCRCWSPSVCTVWNSLKMPECHWIRISYSLRRSRCDFLFEKDRFLVSDSMTHGPARSNRRWGLPTIWRGSRGITASLLVQKNLSTQGGGRCLWHKMKIFWNVATHEIEYA